VAAILVNGAILFALGRQDGSGEPAKRAERLMIATSPIATSSITGASGPTDPQLRRLSFVSEDARPYLLPGHFDESSDQSAWTPTLAAWSVETRTASLEPFAGPRSPVSTPSRLPWLTPPPPPALSRPFSLQERLGVISPGATQRLTERFATAGAAWPPADITLVAIKDQKTLELHARPAGGAWKFVHRYRVLAASGGAGPKLRQGDRQVPEGIYGISFLNPNSLYHVSMRVNYPNAFDRKMASRDGRTNLGGDIMIHGKMASIGCLAVGDEAAEELFVLAANIGLRKVKLIIAPTDFRQKAVPALASGQPAWLPQLYTEVASAMTEYKAPPVESNPAIGLLSFIGNGFQNNN